MQMRFSVICPKMCCKRYLLKFPIDKCICSDWKIWIYKLSGIVLCRWVSLASRVPKAPRVVWRWRADRWNTSLYGNTSPGPPVTRYRNTTGKIQPKMRKQKKTDAEIKIELHWRQFLFYLINSRQIVGILDKSCILVKCICHADVILFQCRGQAWTPTVGFTW